MLVVEAEPLYVECPEPSLREAVAHGGPHGAAPDDEGVESLQEAGKAFTWIRILNTEGPTRERSVGTVCEPTGVDLSSIIQGAAQASASI